MRSTRRTEPWHQQHEYKPKHHAISLKIICLLLPILLMTSVPCMPVTAAQGQLLLTVDSLLNMGIANNLQLRAAAIQQRMAQERCKAARKALLPEVQVGVQAGYLGQPTVFERGLAGAMHPKSPNWQQSYAVDITQPLYHGGRLRTAIKQSDIEHSIAALQTADSEADVKLELLRQYLTLFSYYKQRDVLQRNIEESEIRLKDIRKMKEEGLITNNDVLRSELQLTNDRLSLTEAENSIALASMQLDILLGIDESLLIVPDTTLLERTTTLTDYEACVNDAYENNTKMQIARQQTALARNETQAARNEYLPQVSLYAGNTLARPITRTMADQFSNSWNIGVTVSYSLSSLYKNRDNVGERRSNELFYQNEEERLEQSLRMAIRQAYLDHTEAIDRVKALTLSVRQARENYRIVQNRYLSQLAILTDLLDANSVLLTAELELTVARVTVIYTYYELLNACGRL